MTKKERYVIFNSNGGWDSKKDDAKQDVMVCFKKHALNARKRRSQ